MRSSRNDLTILHVEDDPALAKLVKNAFEHFGFHSSIILADKVEVAIDLLDKRARDRLPVDLILLDFELIDGTGLDLLRMVKSDPFWKSTPVIMLSGETAAGSINAAYALGANCYLPKNCGAKGPLDVLQVLHKFWLYHAFLPQATPQDRLQNVLCRAVHLRSRSADFYFRLARTLEGEPDEMFWIERALNEGNLANLLAFFEKRLSEGDVPAETVERIADMQVRLRKSLDAAERALENGSSPHPSDICRWILDFTDVLDEETVAEGLASLFPKGPAAMVSLKARASLQIRALAEYVLSKAEESEFIDRADAMLQWAERLDLEVRAGNRDSRFSEL